MISEATVRQIECLLAQRLSHREVARRVGVARGTVTTIAKGQRPDYVAMRAAKDEKVYQQGRSYHFCPGCGCHVRMPCLVCLLRRWGQRLAPQPEGREPLRIELRGEERARYEIAHAAKVRRARAGRNGHHVLLSQGGPADDL